MDIFNRPPAIAEDTLQYTLYPPKNLSDKAAVTTFAACIRTYTDSLLLDFVWHRDAFELKVVSDPDPDNDGSRWILEGRMRVGDCVDDEWCTVWLLREVSAKWDLVISVSDSDGEFLLIEAAEALQSWVKPSNSENRVWIYSFRLHLVPISHISPPSRKRHSRQSSGANEDNDRDGTNTEDDNEYISAQDAIKLVRDLSILTVAPPDVENTVWRRISQYPAATRHQHKTKAYIPIDVAKSLVNKPSLIQKAVEAFYTRDAIQLRAAHRMSRFPPNTCVLSTVKMTRTAYAQLVGQKFSPPKVFGHWEEPEGTKEWRWRDVGMKIFDFDKAVGFEMLYHESKGRPDASSATGDTVKASAEAKKDALRRNPEYTTYIQNLVSADYFRGEIEGSELWNILENKAADMFVEVRQADGARRPSFAAQVNNIVSGLSHPVSIPQDEEDSDDWLNVDSQDFEAMLKQTMGNTKSAARTDAMDVDIPETDEIAEERLTSAQATKLKELATKVESFVEGQGDLDGARFEDDLFSDEEFSDEYSQSDEEEENSTQLAARQADMDKLVPGLEPSEYGKMPSSFHSNSQRVAPANIGTDVVEAKVEQADKPEAKPSTAEQPRTKPIRQPIIPRDKYDGVDSDDETDEEEDVEADESDEERPQVVGDIEIDMGEEEEEFLAFSRQALGISDDQWNEIVQDRQKRGGGSPAAAKYPFLTLFPAFLPASAAKGAFAMKEPMAAPAATEKQPQGRTPTPGPRPNVNPNLDSFEAVMQAMDTELARMRPKSTKAGKIPTPTTADKEKGKAKTTVEGEDEDIESAMDAELKAALERGDEDEDQVEEAPDYNLIKNFLESFKNQAGLSGPVSNLAGMLQPGWQLPRDES
ncbi:hypothetical protein D9615_005134 [Tricholomella constricta]|uniref:SGT1-domain-containing protein n=1 Tax=Tricholomella constricta TaxID=117010 RepID=A0A8H5H6B7_9AGAR|nr:hypothetical protein D9615_005134 [Tricholomella constricta]